MSAYSSPCFSMSGVMPGQSEMSHWKTAYVNPDVGVTTPAKPRRGRGPSFSMAGVMPGGSAMSNWNTAYPNGEAIYVAALRNADQRAALAQGTDATASALPTPVTALPAPAFGHGTSVFVRPVHIKALPPPVAA